MASKAASKKRTKASASTKTNQTAQQAANHPTIIPPDVRAAPDGIFPGAHEYGDGLVRWAIYAPGKQSISVIGDWNNWERNADPLFVTTEGLWWTERTLEPGRYAYKFWIDGQQELGDPYATELADEAGGGQPAAVVNVGKTPYSWFDGGWAPPPWNDLVIYELHIGDFAAPFNFQSVIERLPYLQDLGINAIELMPVAEFAFRGWGYNPGYFLCPETSYGTPDEFRLLVDMAHQHGIAIILDEVFAHTAHDHPFNQLYPYDQSPWYGVSLGEQNQFGFPSLDHAKPATQNFLRDVQTWWLQEYHIDGFRYDYTLGIGYDAQNGVTRLVADARAVRPNAYLIAEQSPELPQMVAATKLNGAWHVRFNYMLKALLREGSYMDWDGDNFAQLTEVLSPAAQGYDDQAAMVNYLESHDETRVVFEVASAEHLDEGAARYKSALGAICLFTAPGVPMILHGQEWGEATTKTTEPNPLHWELLNDAGGSGLHAQYRRLIRLRRDRRPLRMAGFAVLASDNAAKTIVYARWDETDDQIVVALNFSPSEQTLMVPFPYAARWLDVLTDEVLEVDGPTSVVIGSSHGRVFVRG